MQLPVQSVQAGGQSSHRQRPGEHIGAGDGTGVLGQMQGLDAAARADVQRRADRAADGGGGQREGGGADAEDVIRSDRAVADVGTEIGDHPPALVRAEVDGGAVTVAVRLQQDACDRRGRGDRERRVHGGGRLGRAEEEQTDQRLQRRAAGGGAQSRHTLGPGQGAGRLLAEQVDDRLGCVTGRAERLGQPIGIRIGQEWRDRLRIRRFGTRWRVRLLVRLPRPGPSGTALWRARARRFSRHAVIVPRCRAAGDAWVRSGGVDRAGDAGVSGGWRSGRPAGGSGEQRVSPGCGRRGCLRWCGPGIRGWCGCGWE